MIFFLISDKIKKMKSNQLIDKKSNITEFDNFQNLRDLRLSMGF